MSICVRAVRLIGSGMKRIPKDYVKPAISRCRQIPKQIKCAYVQGAKRGGRNTTSSIFHGTKNVVKEIGPATTTLTFLGTIFPAPFTSVVGFGLGKVIDKTLKYFKLIK